jgi:TonB-dependent starch-binding outer membrane protein SusC
MKKNMELSGDSKYPWLKKFFRIMKLTTFLILFSVVCVFASETYSQTKKLNLSMNKASVKEVLSAIEEQSEFKFMYSGKIIDVSREVVINEENSKIEDALKSLFKGTDVEYTIKDRIIVLSASGIFNNELSNTEQQKSVSGKVTDSSGAPLPGVTVVVKGTSHGIITDSNGNYSLPNVPDNATMQFSFVGMKTQEIVVEGKITLNVTLVEESIGIEEVVAIGYGTQKREQLTTAISNVKSENFIKGSVTDASQLIKGKIAGLSITTPDGNPVNTSQINLRGITTLVSGSSPLILIDGVPGSLNVVAPEDIESIDVLKDGSAAAIYGTRGTNGVILITTKKVNGEMPASVEVNSYVSTQKITKKLDFMDATQYRAIVAKKEPGSYDYGYNTNWLDEILQTPISQVHNINIKGGSKNTSYVANINYRNSEGIIKKSNNTMIVPRLEITQNLFDGKIKLTGNITGYQQEYFSGSNGGSYNNIVYQNGLTYNPTDRPKNDDGSWVDHVDRTDYVNPLEVLNETHGLNQNNDLRTIGTITFLPISGLNIKMLGSRDLYNSTRGYYETKKHYSTLHDGRNGFASRGTNRTLEELFELTAQYTKTIKDHSINALAGYSWRDNSYQDYSMQNWDFPTDAFDYNNMGAGKALKRGDAPISSYQSQNKLVGFFGRINYAYLNKYLLMASIRHEGSSKFGENHKWGNFPAVSAGWNISKENFMKSIAAISTLKLRAGYGITGTEPTDPYRSLSLINFNTYAMNNGQWSQTVDPSINPNPDLRWEKKEEINLGLDFGLLHERISGSIDVYQRTTRDLLFDYPVSTPPYLLSTLRANAATMENKGIEIQINTTPVQSKDIQWNSSVSFSYNQNKLVSLNDKNFTIASGYFDAGASGEPIQANFTRVQIGQPIGNFWGFKTVDIDATGHWMIEGKDGKPKPILEQQADDKQIIGNGTPKAFLSWNNTVSYKNFDLNVTMRGAFGFQIVNYPRMQYGAPVMLNRGNILASTYDKIYGKVALAADQSLNFVSYYVENGDYWKIDNATIGYNLILKNQKVIKKIRIYASGSNLATFTKYTGIDPEISTSFNGNNLVPGIDSKGRYPASSTYTLGCFLTF